MIEDEEILEDLCKEYNIDPSIPMTYSEILSSEGRFYLDIPCGTGKTVGLAIAAACDPDLSFCYIASTHSRLHEFVDLLSRLKIRHRYMRKSKEILEPIYRDRIVVLTNAMLLQFSYDNLKYYRNERREYIPRALVIDELPDTLLKVYYDRESWRFINSVTSKTYTESKYSISSKLLSEESLWFDFNEILNTYDSYYLENRQRIWSGRNYLFQSMRNKGIPDPKDEYAHVYLSIVDVFTNRSSCSLILDATADLYEELLQAKRVTIEGITKDYPRYINKAFWRHLDHGFNQRSIILEDFLKILKDTKEFLFSMRGPYYLVTHNYSIYEGEGDEKDVNNDILEELKTMFKQVYVSDRKDFILCRSSDDEIVLDEFGNIVHNYRDIFISNFNRSRGSNYFRNCRTVWLLGTFLLPNDALSKMIKDNNFNISPEELQLNFSVADAIQEISRGCLRKRQYYNTMNIIMMGDAVVIDKVFNYLGIDSNIQIQC